MKSLLLAGGLLGFGIGAGLSVVQADSLGSTFWHGCLAAYLMAVLLRWWGGAWRKSLQAALRQREEATPPAPPVTLAKTSKT